MFTSLSTSRAVRAILFDTFGTLVDWRSGIVAAIDEFTVSAGLHLDPERIADKWRAHYQPSMEPIRTGERDYVTLDVLHDENLRAVLNDSGVHPERLDAELLERLGRAWRRLRPWPDVAGGVDQLRRSYPVGPLSNANTALLIDLSRFAKLSWDVVLGSDVFRSYKPDPKVYRRAATFLGLDPGEVMLVAAHNDDLAGARRAGLATGFVLRANEYGAGQVSDLTATGDWDVIARSVPDLAQWLVR